MLKRALDDEANSLHNAVGSYCCAVVCLQDASENVTFTDPVETVYDALICTSTSDIIGLDSCIISNTGWNDAQYRLKTIAENQRVSYRVLQNTLA